MPKASHANVLFGSKADMTGRICNVRFTPGMRTLGQRSAMSALCHKRTSAAAEDSRYVIAVRSSQSGSSGKFQQESLCGVTT